MANSGSVARNATAYLRGMAAGHEATTGELAGVCGRHVAGFARYLDNAVRAGILRRRLVDGNTLWSLGPNSAMLEALPGRHKDSVDARMVPSVFAYAASQSAPRFAVFISARGVLRVERNGVLTAEFSDDERKQIVAVARDGVTPTGDNP